VELNQAYVAIKRWQPLAREYNSHLLNDRETLVACYLAAN